MGHFMNEQYHSSKIFGLSTFSYRLGKSDLGEQFPVSGCLV
ncbi:MAG: hypothetical protein ACI9NT_002883 [Bacteroidia bacterium]